MKNAISVLIALVLVTLASIVPWADAQQKPSNVLIWCKNTNGTSSPCVAGNALDYDTGGGTVNQGTVGIVLPASGGPVAGGTSTNPIRTDPTGTTTQPVSGTVTANVGTTNGLHLDTTFTGRFPTAAASADAIANQTATYVHGFLFGYNGTTWDRLRSTTANGLVVDVSRVQGLVAVTQSGTWSLSANQSINNAQVNGSTIQVASNSMNTAGAGLQATAIVGQCDDTSPTSLTENQFGHARINCTTHHTLVEVAAALPTGSNTVGGVNLTQYTPASGRLPVDPSGVTSPVSMATNTPVGNVAHDGADSGAPLKVGAKATTSISGKTMVANDDRSDLFAGIDGVQIVRPHANLEDRVSAVVGVTDGSSTSLVAAQGAGIRFCATILVVSNSSATNVTVDIRDGTAGSVIMTIPATANMGGAVVPLSIPLCTTANTAMAMDPSAAATTVTVSALGFKTKL